VNGRSSIGWSEKFALDVWYVDHRSFLLDCKILVATAMSVLSAAGMNKPGYVTEEEFMGSSQIFPSAN
jgi:sugar transferase EpsL